MCEEHVPDKYSRKAGKTMILILFWIAVSVFVIAAYNNLKVKE